MLVRFTVQNWRSFRDEASLSMVASREQQHGDRLARIRKYRMRLLPVAAIYGGNASGKSNLVEALGFAKSMVLQPAKSEEPLDVIPFLLDDESPAQPTRFSFEILIDDVIHEYSFSLTREAVVEETLVKIYSSSEQLVFSRRAGEPLSLGPEVRDDVRLKITFEGTDDNQLFLNNAVSQKVPLFRPVFEWFHSLHVIAPTSHFSPCSHMVDRESPLFKQMSAILSSLDTGITRLDAERVSASELNVPEELSNRLVLNLKEGKSTSLRPPGDRSAVVAVRERGGLVYLRQIAHHITDSGKDITFKLDDESDGSRRLVDLLPCLLTLLEEDSNTVLVIDEIDRSLHTLLLRRLLEWFLNSRSSQSRSQLVFTTHDILLMDQSLFRRDEMWITERSPEGASTIVALSEYKDIRYDKDIRKSYLQGRLGGIPRILLDPTLSAAAR